MEAENTVSTLPQMGHLHHPPTKAPGLLEKRRRKDCKSPREVKETRAGRYLLDVTGWPTAVSPVITPAFSASQWSAEGLMDPTLTGGIYRFSWLPGERETFYKGVLPGGLIIASEWPRTYRSEQIELSGLILKRGHEVEKG